MAQFSEDVENSMVSKESEREKEEISGAQDKEREREKNQG